MGNTIQIKTGSGAPEGILVKGELGFDTTNKKLYIGLDEIDHPFMVNPDYPDCLLLSGGKMIGPISFQSSSLPGKTLEFVCGIDSFANGGQLGWQTKDDFLSGYAKTSNLANYVTTNTAQTITAAKTFSGQILTSFKSAVAMGTYQASATTVGALVEEVRKSSGCAGSVNFSANYTKNGVIIPKDWYNFIYIPHRSGGVNGAETGDNCNYGTLFLMGMTVAYQYFRIRVNGKVVTEVNKIDETSVLYDGSATNGTVTLKESVANFSYIEVIYGYSDVPAGSATIHSPNNKTFDVSCCSTQNDKNIIQVSRARYVASGTTISISGSINQRVAYDGSWAKVNNNIYIHRVIGHR